MPYKKKRRFRGAPRRQEGQSKISNASSTRRKRQRSESLQQQQQEQVLLSSTLVISSDKNGKVESTRKENELLEEDNRQTKRVKTSPELAKESRSLSLSYLSFEAESLSSEAESSSEVSWSEIRRSIDRLELSSSSTSSKGVNNTEEVECDRETDSNAEISASNTTCDNDNRIEETEEKKIECEKSRSASPEMLTASQDRRADHRSRTSILFYTPLSASTLDYHKNNNNYNHNKTSLENGKIIIGGSTQDIHGSNITFNKNNNTSSQPLFSDPGENDEGEEDKCTKNSNNTNKNVIDMSGINNEQSMEVLIASEDDNSHYSANNVTEGHNNNKNDDEYDDVTIKHTQRYFNTNHNIIVDNNNTNNELYCSVSDGVECAMSCQTLETQLLPLTCNSSIDSNNLLNSKEVTISPIPHTPSPLPYLLAEMENQNYIEHLHHNFNNGICINNNTNNNSDTQEKESQNKMEGKKEDETLQYSNGDDDDESVDNRRLTVSAQDKSLSAILHTPIDTEEMNDHTKVTCDIRLSNELRNAANTEYDMQLRYSNEYTPSKGNILNNKKNVPESDLESVHCESVVNNTQSFLIHAETDMNAIMQKNLAVSPSHNNHVLSVNSTVKRNQEQKFKNADDNEEEEQEEEEEEEEEGRLSVQRLTRVLANKPRASPGTMWICLDDDEEDEKDNKSSNNDNNHPMDNKENVEHYNKSNKSQKNVYVDTKSGKEANRELEELHKLTTSITHNKLRSSSISREPPIHEMLSPTFRPRRASVASVMRSASKQSMMARVLEQYPYIKMDDSDEENNNVYNSYSEEIDKKKNTMYTESNKMQTETSANLLNRTINNKLHREHDEEVSNMESVNILNTPHKESTKNMNVPTYILHDDSEDEHEQSIKNSFEQKPYEEEELLLSEEQEEQEEKVILSSSSSSLESLSSPLSTRATRARTASETSENKNYEINNIENVSTKSASSSETDVDENESEFEEEEEDMSSYNNLEHIRDAVSHLHSLYPKRITKKTFTSIAQEVLPEAHFLEPHTFWSAFKHAEYVGEGSFGIVWKCTTIDNDIVAVKSCPVSLRSRGNIEDGLSTLREIAILRFLNEQQVPYVLPLHSAFCVKGNEVLPPEVCKAFEFKRSEKRRAEEAALPLAVQQLSIGAGQHKYDMNTSEKEEEDEICKDDCNNEHKGKRKGPNVNNNKKPKRKNKKKMKETKADKKTREAKLKECLSKEVTRQLQRIREEETQEQKSYRAQMNAIRLPKFLSITQDDVLESEWTLFLVTELCDGDVENITRSESVMKGVAFCVSTALEQMHRFGLLHLDLKPSNVLFAYDRKNASEEEHHVQTSPHNLKSNTTNNNCKAVKFYLSDFGNCRLVGPSRLDSVEDAYGTFEYMDLRALRDKVCSRATDCFSLGCTLFEMMFGQRVYPKCCNPRCKVSGGNGSGTSDEMHDRFCYIEAAKQHITLPISANAGIENKSEIEVNDTVKQNKISKYNTVNKNQKVNGKRVIADNKNTTITVTQYLTPLQQITLNLLNRNWRERMTIAECRMQLLHAYNLHNVRS